ncbi:hypothetical protein K3495_g1320 [Podosphaera aphanis]|nr:hypothetical protein K3495_g1320 [Podosphaera aphanis]
MPFNCAREICATFCYHIAPAIIPLFGPSFPSLCANPNSPEFGYMVISSNTIAEAAIEIESLKPKDAFFPIVKSTTLLFPPYSCSHISKHDFKSRTMMNQRTPQKRKTISYYTGDETASFFDSQSYETKYPCTWQQTKHGRCLDLSESIIAISPSLYVLNSPHPILTAIPRSTGNPCMSLWRQAESTDAHEITNNFKYTIANNEKKYNSTRPNLETQSGLIDISEETSAAYSLINLSVEEDNLRLNYSRDQSRQNAKRRRANSI